MKDTTIKAVVFDWAGTTIDYGCMAPVMAIKASFNSMDVQNLTDTDIRQFMGMNKRNHLEKLMELTKVKQTWLKRYNSLPTRSDVDRIYSVFEKFLFKYLKNYSTLIPGVITTIDKLREMGIKIGSCTGYSREMMNIVQPIAERYGYRPEIVVTSSDVTQGRPDPAMCYKIASELKTYPMYCMVKVGDTIADIQEGLNAGMWSIATILGSNELGISYDELETIENEILSTKIDTVRSRFIRAGAHYVLESIYDLPKVIEEINHRLGNGERP